MPSLTIVVLLLVERRIGMKNAPVSSKPVCWAILSLGSSRPFRQRFLCPFLASFLALPPKRTAVWYGLLAPFFSNSLGWNEFSISGDRGYLQ